MAVGASLNDANALNSGHVRVYEFDGSSWSQMGSDINGVGQTDMFGRAVSLSDNGLILAIGALYHDGNGDNSGVVQVYEFIGSSWQQLGSDLHGEAAGDNFGTSVSLSSDGGILAVGARYYDNGGVQNSGHVRVYSYDGSSWIQIGGDINGEASQNMSGWSVSLSDRGNIVSIGAYYNDGITGVDSGHVRVYAYPSKIGH